MDLERRLASSADALDAAIDSYLAGGQPNRPRRRWIATTAAAALVAVGIGGVALTAARGDHTSEPGTAVSRFDPPATAASTGEIGDDRSDTVPAADEELLGYVYALMLPAISRDEAVAFLAWNVPEPEVATCMSAAGLDYSSGPSPEEQVASDVRYTTSAEEYAANYGLGITGWDLGIIPAPSSDRTGEGADAVQSGPTYDESLARCRGMFDEERRAWSDAINVTVELFRAVVGGDERMVAGLADWQSCMADADFGFETPMSMRESFYARMNNTDEDLQQIFDDEVRVAVANVQCEAAYLDVQREVISSRFHEFQAMFEAAVASGASPAAQG